MTSVDTFGLRFAATPEAQSARTDARLDLTQRRSWVIVLLAPVALIGVLELTRVAVIGAVDLRWRLLLDGIVAAAFALFGILFARAIDRMHERLKRQNRELLALHRAGLDVASELSLDAVLKKVVDQARSLVGARYGALSVVGEDGRIESFITSGISAEARAAIGPPPVGHGVLGVVLHEGQRLRLADVAQHPRSSGFPPNHPPMRSLLAVPITCKSPFLGNLYLAEKQNNALFSDDDEQTLERFAVQAAIAIDNAHLHSQVASLAVAQERLRIAHEMHDGIAQVLGYVNTKVQAANAYLSRGKSEQAAAQLSELAAAAREAYTDVRESIVGLRSLPTGSESLAQVLQEYLERWKQQSGLSTQMQIDHNLGLPVAVELQLIRIVQEALANVRKHAKATTVSIDIARRDGRMTARIADDGVGFNPAARTRSDFPRFGLATMRERAESVGGTLRVESEPGSGTTVVFELPYAE